MFFALLRINLTFSKNKNFLACWTTTKNPTTNFVPLQHKQTQTTHVQLRANVAGRPSWPQGVVNSKDVRQEPCPHIPQPQLGSSAAYPLAVSKMFLETEIAKFNEEAQPEPDRGSRPPLQQLRSFFGASKVVTSLHMVPACRTPSSILRWRISRAYLLISTSHKLKPFKTPRSTNRKERLLLNFHKLAA